MSLTITCWNLAYMLMSCFLFVCTWYSLVNIRYSTSAARCISLVKEMGSFSFGENPPEMQLVSLQHYSVVRNGKLFSSTSDKQPVFHS